jgi:hypothetical protein
MKRNKKLGKAISPVLSTVILTSVMLIVALTIMAFANNVFSIQSDTTEFDQAKNIMVNFAGIVDDVAMKEGSSGYVRFNTRSGGPYFSLREGTIMATASVDDGREYTLIQGHTNLFKYRAGSYTSAAGRVTLCGVNKSIILNNEAALGEVYTEQKGGAWVVLNFTRIGILDLGTFNFTKGYYLNGSSIGYRLVNIIQVSYVNLTMGPLWSGSGSVNSVATCKNITTVYAWLPSPQPVGADRDYDITFKVYLNSHLSEPTQTITVKGFDRNYVNANGQQLGIDTMITVVISNVEINTIG